MVAMTTIVADALIIAATTTGMVKHHPKQTQHPSKGPHSFSRSAPYGASLWVEVVKVESSRMLFLLSTGYSILWIPLLDR